MLLEAPQQKPGDRPHPQAELECCIVRSCSFHHKWLGHRSGEALHAGDLLKPAGMTLIQSWNLTLPLAEIIISTRSSPAITAQ